MGRQILGAVSGLFFGLFLAVDLVMFGLLRFESPVVLVLPVFGLVLGLGLAAWSPFSGTAQRQDDSASMTSDGA